MPEAHPTVDVEDLVGDLRFEFPDIPERALAHYVLRAATRMCREGDLARRKAVIRTTPGVEAYTLDTVGQVEVSSVLSVAMLPGREPVPRFPVRTTEGVGPRCWFVPPDELHYHDRSALPRTLEVEFSVSPLRDADVLDRDLGERHCEVLLAGVRSLIYGIGGKPWFNPEIAEFNARKFASGVAAAKSADLTGRQKGVWRNRYERVL